VAEQKEAVTVSLGGTQTPAWIDIEWVVVGYRVADALTSPLASNVPTVRFDPSGTVSGTTGCNRYTGQYTLDGDELAVSPLASTRMMGAEDVMEQEMAYLAALPWVASAKVIDGELVLTDLDGAPVVVARANT
jgi:heat shock protein HslJ